HLDPVVYDAAQRRGGTTAERRLRVMPEPVEAPMMEGRSAILRRYELPEEGRYLGAAGLIDVRKGMDLLIRAFAAAKLGPRDRLLLMGPQEAAIRALLAGEFQPLVRAGRILSVDRPMSSQELA